MIALKDISLQFSQLRLFSISILGALTYNWVMILYWPRVQKVKCDDLIHGYISVYCTIVKYIIIKEVHMPNEYYFFVLNSNFNNVLHYNNGARKLQSLLISSNEYCSHLKWVKVFWSLVFWGSDCSGTKTRLSILSEFQIRYL